MASGYTANYGLSQWAPGDQFLRTEFNRDNARLDAAVAEAARGGRLALDGLADLGYNVYNLALQGYYDGKQTGYKRAMLFDGFRDGSMIASLSGGVQRGGGVLSLQSAGQGNIVIGYGSQRKYVGTTADKRITGSGVIHGFQCQLYSGMTVAASSYLSYTLTRNGTAAAQGTADTPEFAPQSTQTVTVTFPGGVAVGAGDTVSLKLESAGSAWLLTMATDNSTLAGTFLIRSVTGSAGRMTGRAVDLPACGGVRGWVRYQGGGVSLALRGKGDAVWALEADGTRSTVNLQGASCTEAAFRLDRALEAGNTAVLLDLDLNGAPSMEVFDYGVVLL